MHMYEAIIVGGGTAGLGCARHLTERGVSDFLLLTKDIGGRALTSADGQVNYGAYYVRKDYKHLLPYLRLKRKIRLSNLCFAHGRCKATMFDLRNLRHLPDFLRFTVILLRVFRRYLRAKKRFETAEQIDVIRSDALLSRLYKQSGSDFVHEYGLQFWIKGFFDPLVRSTAFMDLRECNAFEMLACIFPLLTGSYEFEPQFERLIAPFFSAIKHDAVTRVERTARHWVVTTEKGDTYAAKSVVLALPIEVSKTLVPIAERTNAAISVYMMHLRGTPRPHWAHPDFFMFPEGNDDIVIARQQNGTFLFYSRNAHSDVSRYFQSWEVIAKRHWDPAFHMGGHLLRMDRGDGLYVIGDHNLCGMEDSYVTGMFAANRIAGTL